MKIILWIVLSIVGLLLVLTLVFSFPSVQTFAAKKAVTWVNDKYQTDFSLQRFRYVFPDNFLLKEVFLQDDDGDTLIYASDIKLGFGGFNSIANSAYSGGVTIDNLRFYWHKKKGSERSNFSRFIAKFSSGDTTATDPFNLFIDDVEIRSGIFWYEDFTCSDCSRFLLKKLNLEMEDFAVEGDYVKGNIRSLSARDRYGLDLYSFRGDAEYQADHISVEGLKMKTARSSIQGDVRLEYESMEDFDDFVNKVRIVADLNESYVESEEIIYITSDFPDFEKFTVEGKVEGIVNDLSAENLNITLGTNTRFDGNIVIRNTTETDSLFLNIRDLDLRTSSQDMEFVNGLFSDSTLPGMISALGNIAVTGNFKGYLRNFNTQAVVATKLGTVTADLTVDNIEDSARARYKGDVATKGFDLGRLLNDSTLGTVAARMHLEGSGYDPTTMNTSLNGKVDRVQYAGYDYRNILVDGRIANSNFKGRLSVKDPNLDFAFNGTASFGKDTSLYNFTADLIKADLHALKLVDDTVAVVTGEMDMNLTALNYERWAGDVRIFNTTFENPRNFYFFQDITIHSEGLDSTRYLELRSGIADANLQGQYTFKGVVHSVKAHVNKFLHTREVPPPPSGQDFYFDITVKNANIVTEIFFPDLEIRPNSRLVGDYSSTSNVFNIDVVSPGFVYNNNEVKAVDLTYNGGAERSQLGFTVGGLTLKNGFEIDSIRLANYYYQDTLFYDLRWIFRDSVDSRANINGYAIQNDTTTFEFGIFKSDFNVGYQKFVITDDNRILIDTGGIHIEDLIIANEGRRIVINGNISDNENEILRLNMEGFGMELVNYFVGSPDARFQGNLNGNVILTQLLANPKFAANLRIDSLKMNNTLLGDFDLVSDWTVRNDTIRIESSMTLGDLTTFSGKGFYQPDSLGTISLDVEFDRFRLAAFNPFLSGVLENLRGYVSGQAKVRGNTGSPEVTGDLSLPRTAFTVSFLQTDYNVEGSPKVRIFKDRITFPDLTLRDTKFGTEGKLSGDITHRNFRNFQLDLNVRSDELLALNTDETTDDSYYGTAFVGGDISIKGPTDALIITAKLTSKERTSFYIPVFGATEVSQSNFVSFVNSNEPDSILETKSTRFNLGSGVSLHFDLNINPNAEVIIVIDEEAGNQLQARGSGNIQLDIDPFSDIEIYGTYTVVEGTYNFALQGGLLKKKFEVMRGGTVTWNGDPYNALINLSARYTTRADPSALLSTSGAASTYNGGKTLTYVDLFLSGELENPEITFDVSAPRASSQIQSIMKTQLSDQDKQYQQVMSLLAFNSFAPEGGLEFAGSGWDILAGQASNYLNQLTGDYEFTLGYQEGAANDPSQIAAQEEVEVGVSKRFFNNRITVNGSVGVPVGDQTQNPNSQIAGDFEIEYSITEDGRFRAKAFNRLVQDAYNFSQQNYQQGVGIFYRVDFDKVFGNRKEKAVRDEDDGPGEPEETKPGRGEGKNGSDTAR